MVASNESIDQFGSSVTHFTVPTSADRSHVTGHVAWEEDRMNPCWVLVVARGLRVWLPPEIYVSRRFAEKESERWRTVLRIAPTPPRLTGASRSLHLVRSRFPDPWRACPLWAGLTWSSSSYPRMKLELMAADDGEAADWLRRRCPRTLDVKDPGQHVFDRREIQTAVGVFRVKRVVGF